MNTENTKLVILIDALEARLKQATDTISNLNAIISGLGVMAAIFIAISGAAVYFLGIKPSQDAVDKLEETMDQRITAYLKNEKTKQIQRSVDSIQSTNLITRATALSHLISNLNGEKLTDTQVAFLTTMAKQDSIDDRKLAVEQLLLYQGKSDMVDAFFYAVIEHKIVAKTSQQQLYNIAIQYFTLTANSGEYVHVVENIIQETDDKFNTINYILSMNMTKERMLAILYSESITNNLVNAAETQMHKNNESFGTHPVNLDYRSIAHQYNITDAEYDQTYFYNAILKKNSETR